MVLLNIAIGLIGLGVVVFVHEFGHLLAAKAVGIEVEAFSIGWGKKIWSFQYRGTDYRLSVFPFGGYCKMKGETLMQQAWQHDEESVPREPGSFFAASPLRRIFVSAAGPAVNLLFAIVVLSIVWGIGFQIQTFSNRIVLASDVEQAQQQTAAQSPEQSQAAAQQQEGRPAQPPQQQGSDTQAAAQQGGQPEAGSYPADRAGLQTGDEIIQINGQEIDNFQDLQRIVAQSARKRLTMTVERGGQTRTIEITPALDEDTGAGRIGVYPWIEPVIARVESGSPAGLAGLQPGDVIVRAGGEEVRHTMDFRGHVRSSANPIELVYERSGARQTTTLVPRSTREGAVQTGIQFEALTVETPEYGLFGAIGRGAQETFNTLSLTVYSLRLLFSGIDPTQAVAGPLRITYYIGDVATSGFTVGGLGTSIRSLFNFLSLLSVALFFMNLLPIPVLDGGQIVLYTVEGLRRRPLRPRSIYWYQMIGMVIIFGIIVFALFGDILFLAGGGS